jgi:hypothetical protein
VVIRWKWLILLVLAVIVAVGIYLFRGNESSRVQRQFRRLAESVSKTSGEGNLTMVMKTETFQRLFAPECDLEFKEQVLNGVFTPDQLVAQLVRGRSQLSTITASFPDVVTTFPENDLAVVAATARFQATHRNGQAVDETRELECELRKIGGEWRFQRVAVVEVLKR